MLFSMLLLAAALAVDVILQEKNPITVYPGIVLGVWPKTDGRDGIRLREQVLAIRELGVKGFCLFEWAADARTKLDVFRGVPDGRVRPSGRRSHRRGVSRDGAYGRI